MPVKTILVYVPHGRDASATLEPVLNLASPRNAHVIGLHLTPDLPVYGEFPAEVSQEVVERLQKAGDEAAAAAKRAFEDSFKGSAVTHEWRGYSLLCDGGGSNRAAMRGVDLIVCGKASDEIPTPGRFAETALMQVGGHADRAASLSKPVERTPSSPAEATRAVSIARPDTGRGFGARDHLDRR
jgi:hypothetical protein